MTIVVWILGLVASSIALMMGCITKNLRTAMELSPMIFVPQILFAGFFIPMSQIPVWLRWAQYLCSLKYAINLLITLEFANGACPAEEKFECDEILSSNDVEEDRWWLYATILVVLVCGFRLIAFVSLKAKASVQ